ncbi:MAG TPA: polyphenol oxidase family protein [Acidimicrobiales bacterium]|nr:polyphenol oxidase family protein [Acidimicrobiales bacterium]
MAQVLDTVTWQQRRGLGFMGWRAFNGLPVDALVTTRGGGVSAGAYESLNFGLHVGDDDAQVVENRRRAAQAMGASLDDLVVCNQTHGRGVWRVQAGDRGKGATSLATAIDGTDALVTAEPGPVLVMMWADCVPVVLYDPVAHAAAAIHSGWRGTVARVTDATIEAMVGLGSDPGNMIAGVGPAIDPAQYRVGAEVAEAASRCFGVDIDEVIRPNDAGGTGPYLFDLWQANRRLLLEAGVPPEHIHVARVPTGGGGPFFSDRAVRPCGRNALLVRLHPRS